MYRYKCIKYILLLYSVFTITITKCCEENNDDQKKINFLNTILNQKNEDPTDEDVQVALLHIYKMKKNIPEALQPALYPGNPTDFVFNVNDKNSTKTASLHINPDHTASVKLSLSNAGPEFILNNEKPTLSSAQYLIEQKPKHYPPPSTATEFVFNVNDKDPKPLVLQCFQNLSHSSPANTPPEQKNEKKIPKGNTPPRNISPQQRNEKTPPKSFTFHTMNYGTAPGTETKFVEETTTTNNKPGMSTFTIKNLSTSVKKINFNDINTKEGYNKISSGLDLKEKTKCSVQCNYKNNCDYTETGELWLVHHNIQTHQKTKHLICACNKKHNSLEDASNCPNCS